jgi:hypothetical protein
VTSSDPRDVSSWKVRPWTFSWAGLALGPAAWAIDTQLNYSMLGWSCGKGWNPVPVIAAVLAAISLAGAASSFAAWRRHDGPGMPIPEQDGHPRHLLSGIGVAAGVLFAIVIALQGIAGVLLEPCLR